VTRRVFGLAAVGVLAACGIDALGQAVDPKLPEDEAGRTEDASTSDAPSSEDAVAGDATTAIDGGADADARADAEAGCPSGMVGVLDAGYCIDGREVIEEKWAAFLAADAGKLPTECAFKTGFSAGSARGAALPVSDVDWCDAFAYCAWAGKRLCGAQEWTKACTGGTSRVYPYGDVFDDQKCNGGPLGAPAAPGTFAQCVGPIPGIVDMSGNMDEWTRACATQTGATDLCESRGGDWKNDPATELMCSSALARPRDTILDYVGFRCCK
jgi:formylglycine-generating enzyme